MPLCNNANHAFAAWSPVPGVRDVLTAAYFCSPIVLMLDLRSELRITISLALTMIPRTVRRDYSEKLLIRSDPAKERITEAIVESILSGYAVEKKPSAMPSIRFDTRAPNEVRREREALAVPMPEDE